MTIKEKAKKYDELVRFLFDPTSYACFTRCDDKDVTLIIRTIFQLKQPKEIK